MPMDNGGVAWKAVPYPLSAADCSIQNRVPDIARGTPFAMCLAGSFHSPQTEIQHPPSASSAERDGAAAVSDRRAAAAWPQPDTSRGGWGVPASFGSDIARKSDRADPSAPANSLKRPSAAPPEHQRLGCGRRSAG